MKIKENEKIIKYFDLARELGKLRNKKITVIPVVVRVLGTVSKSLEKKLKELEICGKIETHPDYNIVKIGWNTEMSPGDPRKLAITQTPVKILQLKLVWTTRKDYNNNEDDDDDDDPAESQM